MKHHLHYPQNYLVSKHKYSVPWDSPKHFVSTACLHKYFPKYYKNLTLHLSHHKTASKIKSLKKISTITSHVTHELPKNSWKPLLSAQKRHLQALPIFTYFVESWDEQVTSQSGAYDQARFFTNLNEISFCPATYLDVSKLSICEYKNISQTCRYLKGLKLLKRVEITFDSEISLKPVTCLERQKRLLGQLEDLSVSVKRLYWRETTPIKELMENLLGQKNFMKHVTRIAFKEDVMEDNVKILGGLPELSPRLKEIDFEVNWNEENEANGMSLLSSLERFKDLKVLKLVVADSRTLMKEFTMPKGIEDVTIQWSFKESLGNLQRIEYMLKNQDEYGGALLSFLEKWKGLTKMKRLEIECENIRDPGLVMNELVKRIMREISNLSELKVKMDRLEYFSCKEDEEEVEEGDNKIEDYIDLTSFLQSIQHLGENLNAIELDIRIGDEDRRELKQESKPRNLRIKGRVKGDNLKENLAVLFAERFQGYEIQIDRVFIYSVEQFVRLFETMGKMKRPRDMKIDLGICWKIFEIDGFEEGMKKLRQGLKYMKGVSIGMVVYQISAWYDRVRKAEELKEVFERFNAGYCLTENVEGYLKDNTYD